MRQYYTLPRLSLDVPGLIYPKFYHTTLSVPLTIVQSLLHNICLRISKEELTYSSFYRQVTSQIISEYVYDFNGNKMVKKNYRGGTLHDTVTSWSDSYETKVIVGGATENTAYYFANGELIAKKDNAGNRTYFHNDHLGSTTVITNSSGVLVEETKYDPWGEVKVGGTKSKFLYTGQEKDIETGLNYYNFRYYNSHIRRFTQPDNIIPDIYKPQYLNKYTYVLNNPLRYTDPSGHNPVAVFGGAFATGLYIGAFARTAIDSPDTSFFGRLDSGIRGGNHMLLDTTIGQIALTSMMLGPLLSNNSKQYMQDDKLAKETEGIITQNTKTYSTSVAAKKDFGSPGKGNQWHHIVEQNQTNIDMYTPQAIHNRVNMQPVSTQVNQSLNGYYSSKQPFSYPLTVRDWLAPQTYKQKYDFGLIQLDRVLSNNKK